MGAKLSGALPDGEHNGLGPILGALTREPRRIHLALVAIDTKTITRDADSGDEKPTVRVRRIEVVAKEDLRAAEQLMRRALQRRAGDTVLPLEMEHELDELGELFDAIESGKAPDDDADGKN